MASINERWEDNSVGKYYVDKSCIMCNVCSDIAPTLFNESESGDHHVLVRQPANSAEEQSIRDAIDQCPVDAIGEDGAY